MVVGNWRAARLREMTSSVPSVMSGSGGCATRGLGNASRCFLTTTLRHCAGGGSPNFRGAPQSSSTDIQDGQNAEVSVRERLGRVYTGKIIRNADALDAAARTLRTEVQVDKRDDSLLPGMYAQVKFTLPTARRSFIIPASLLISHSKGQRIVILSADHTFHFVPVVLGRDMGISAEILQ